MRLAFVILALAIGIAGTAARFLGGARPVEQAFQGSVTIAFVAALDGSVSGQEMRRAAEDAIGRVNAEGGINGLRVQLAAFDDGNDAERARSVARRIASDPGIVGVIGHNYSAASLAAAPIYAAAGLPAITPASTNSAVTANNEWYFRTIYDDEVQGQFLAYYAAEALGSRRVALLTVPSVFADGLSSIIRSEASRLGLAIALDWRAESGTLDDARLPELVARLAELPEDTVVLVAATLSPATGLVRGLRDGGVGLRILGPDSLGTSAFARAFANLPRQQASPGFYTNNVFVSVPFLADTANIEARHLLDRMAAQGEPLTSWGAPYAYDAAKVLMEGLRRAGVGPEMPPDVRRRLRDQLAQMRTPGQGVAGATGITWFDSSGTARKPTTIGQFSGQLISSLVQLRQIRATGNLDAIPVVYSGIALKRVERLPADPGQVEVDFDIWFRFQGDVPVDDIMFAGAVEPIRLGAPVRATSSGDVQYRLYSARGRFRVDTGNGRAARSHIGVSVAFHHRSLPEERLIFVPDATALSRLSGPALAREITQGGTMPSGYVPIGALLSTDRVVRSTQGNPSLSADGTLASVGLPGLALTVDFGPEVPPLRRQWLGWESQAAALGLLLAFAMLLAVENRWVFASRPRFALLLVGVSTFGLLLTGENAAIGLMVELDQERWTDALIRTFDLGWWVAAAVLLLMALHRLVWQPLETRSGRPVPQVLKTFLGALVLLAAAFGIFSNVLERDITGLVATSGILAMIIGLAVQSNLSNIFSGIALNIERPIRPGDWAKIGDAPPAEVLDISWRATTVRTHVNTVLSIPNSVVTGVRIENYSHPQPYFMLEQWIHVDARHDPEHVAALLVSALQAVKPIDGRERLGVCHSGFGGVDARGASYIVRYDCVDMAVFGWLSHVVMVQVERDLREAGIAMLTGRTEVRLARGEATQPGPVTAAPDRLA
jgi:branched-chain amino acid transport system substrate-binding protein